MNRFENTIESLIDEAYILVEADETEQAANQFHTARRLLVSGIEPKQMRKKLLHVRVNFAREAREYKDELIAHVEKENLFEKVVIISDSLALPRPLEMKGQRHGLELAYPYWLQEKIKDEGKAVISWGQRYMTTQLFLDNYDTISQEVGGFSNADMVIHIGLNDYVERMFLEEERIAMDMLPSIIKEKMAKFAQKHRMMILDNQDDYAYVPSGKFRENIENIILKLRQDNVKSIMFVNQIALPMDRWKYTANYIYIFTRCNMVFYEMSKKYGVKIVDIDRLVWQNGLKQMLNDDMMHLGLEGHKMLSQSIANEVLEC